MRDDTTGAREEPDAVRTPPGRTPSGASQGRDTRPERAHGPAEPAGTPCDLCGAIMRESHCKLVCDQCGYVRDCSDP